MNESNKPRIRKRKTVLPTACPNPLFEKWLTEWKDEAACKNLDLQYCFAKALVSLRKYPLKLNSGKECLVLKNFGNQLCVKLDRKLAEYKKYNPDEYNAIVNDNSNNLCKDLPLPIAHTTPTKRRKRKIQEPTQETNESLQPSPNKKKYVPAYRSGPYAILITLYKERNRDNYLGYSKKAELQEKAQCLCDSSFKKPDPGSHYTAWSSMSLLIKKGLVKKEGNPARFSLTSSGAELAQKLASQPTIDDYISPQKLDFNSNPSPTVENSAFIVPKKKATVTNLSSKFNSVYQIDLDSNTTSVPSLPTSNTETILSRNDFAGFSSKLGDAYDNQCIQSTYSDSQSSGYSSCSNFEQIILQPGEFEVILLVDTQETTGGTRNTLSDDTCMELRNLDTKFEVRRLKVGDFTWIARDRYGNELVLPYIVERKRMDDLGQSIKDGRFHEQKFRLKQSGLNNVIYLVENYGNNARVGLPISTLQQAIVNTHIVDEFLTKITANHHQSMVYLSVLTKLLETNFKDKTLLSCPKSNLPEFNMEDDLVSLITYIEFSKISVKTKNYKIREMFIKQLLQLKGLSVDKATAIVEQYRTPFQLISAYKQASNGELMLANIRYGNLQRNIGPTISKFVYRLYNDKCLN